MGLLRAHTSDSYFKNVLLIEMIARTIKVYTRSFLRLSKRKLQDPGVQSYKNVIITILNLALGTQPESANPLENSAVLPNVNNNNNMNVNFNSIPPDQRQFWQEIKKLLIQKYPLALSNEELSASYNLFEKGFRTTNVKAILFQKLKQMLGLRFEPSQEQLYLRDPNVFENPQPFGNDQKGKKLEVFCPLHNVKFLNRYYRFGGACRTCQANQHCCTCTGIRFENQAGVKA